MLYDSRQHGLAVCNRLIFSVCTLHPTAVVRCVKCNTRCFRDNELTNLTERTLRLGHERRSDLEHMNLSRPGHHFHRDTQGGQPFMGQVSVMYQHLVTRNMDECWW